MLVLILSLSVYAKEHKVLFDLQTGNVKVLQKQLIDEIGSLQRYYLSQAQKLEVVVLVSGNAYKFFLKDTDKTLYSLNKSFIKVKNDVQMKLRLLSSDFKVRFETCESGMKHRGIAFEQLVDFIEPVYSHNVGLINLQNEGYAHIRVY